MPKGISKTKGKRNKTHRATACRKGLCWNCYVMTCACACHRVKAIEALRKVWGYLPSSYEVNETYTVEIPGDLIDLVDDVILKENGK